ncbi:MAG TPA: hypothetical protein EYP71_01760 [Dehalococcoidia bacterium]|nr:hypothetical protein [Dehalococcoidia bacterium]
MGKLEAIRQVLVASGNLSWNEETARSPYPRGSGYYYSHGFRIAPEEPVLTAQGLRSFSNKLVRQLIPLSPASVSWCSIFSGKREAVRIPALYFREATTEVPECQEMRIRVSIFPCCVMAENVGYRGIIEIGGYECPEPCELSSKCTFKTSKWRTLRRLL